MVTFQFVPYDEIEGLEGSKRVSKLLQIVKQGKIVLLQGRLRREEEANLIETTMEQIDDKFEGVELSVIYPSDHKYDGWEKFKHLMLNTLLGDRQGFTIVGPASVVRKIERNPNKIELFTQERKRRR